MVNHQLDALSKTWIGAEVWLEEVLHELHMKYTKFREVLKSNPTAASSNGSYEHFIDNYNMLAMLFQTLCSTNEMYVQIFSNYVKNYSFYINKMAKDKISKQMQKQCRLIRYNLHEYESDVCEPITFNVSNPNQFIDYCIQSGNVTNNQILDQQMHKCSDAQRQKIQNIQLLQLIIELQESTITDVEIESNERITQYKDLESAFELTKHRSITNFYKREIDMLEKLLAQTLPEKPNALTEDQLIELIRNIVEAGKCSLDQIKIIIIERIKQNELSVTDNDLINKQFLKFSSDKWFRNIDEKLKSSGLSINEIFKNNTDLNKAKNLNLISSFCKDSKYYKMIIEQYNLIECKYEKQLLEELKSIFVNYCYAEGMNATYEFDFAAALIEYLNIFPNLDDITDLLKLQEFCEDHTALPALIETIVHLKWIYQKLAFENLRNAATKLLNQSQLYYAKQIQEELIAYLEPPVIRQIRSNDKEIIEVIGTNVAVSKVINDVEKMLHDRLIEEIRFVAGNVIHLDESLQQDKWHGKNLVMTAPKAIVHGAITLDVSGKDNQVEHAARNHSDIATDKMGLPGRDGFAGESGGNVSLLIDQLEHSQHLTIISNGGNGSIGEDGGDGKGGENGTGLSLSEFDNICKHVKKNKVIPKKDNLQIINEFHLNETLQSSYQHIEEVNKKYTIKTGYSGMLIPYPKFLIFKVSSPELTKQIYVFCSGGFGSPGGIGGEYGLGGEGGKSGNIDILNKNRHNNIQFQQNQGKCGENGKSGKYGEHGKNGWDLGYLCNDFIPKEKVYGKNLNSKIMLEYSDFSSMKLANFSVECPYMLHLKKSYNLTMKEATIENKRIESHQSKMSSRPNRKRQHHALANRKQNISQNEIVASYSHIVNKNHIESLKIEHLNKMKCVLENIQQEEIRKDISTEVTVRRQIIDSDIKNNKISINNKNTPRKILNLLSKIRELSVTGSNNAKGQRYDAGPDRDRNVTELVNLIYKNENTTVSVKENLNEIANNLMYVKLSVPIKYQKDIRNWIKSISQRLEANQNNAEFMHKMYVEMLAVIDEIIFLMRNIRLRDTQKLAVLILLTHQRNILEQVTTGEGKTLIVVAVAIIKALCGGKVDIVTSSPVLAIRDAAESKELFNLFGINVSHNCYDSIGERKQAYASNQVIYGVLCNFQQDFLLDRFYGKNILCGRDLQNVIIDEVDSLLLDRGVNMLYLTHDMPGFDKLESVYIFIWEIINSPVNSIQEVVQNFDKNEIKEAILRDICGLITKEDLKEIDPEFNDEQINSLWECLIKGNVIDKQGFMLIKNENKFNPNAFKLPSDIQHRSERIDFLISSNIRRKRHINMPNYLKPFVVRHLESWISNAINAFLMIERIDYVVDIDRSGASSNNHPIITILDKDTGTDQTNSEWSDALHQFLQLKHGCKITPQSLKSVFISNISYFKMYQNMCGLTGTLGSQAELEILKKMHEVDFVTIPTTKLRMFEERSEILCQDRSSWIDTIISNAKQVTIAERRSILIICESVLDVEELKKRFAAYKIDNVITYTRDYNEFIYENGKNELEPLNIIISTNLAGRGTDIKLNRQLQMAGGLHVCLTYLPGNNRIEEQAFGRAARCGQRGSGQLIIMPPNVHNGGDLNIEEHKKCRDNIEMERLLKITNIYDTEIKMEEKCFKIFKDEYEQLKRVFDGKKIAKSVVKFLLQCCLDDWAVWLNENETMISEAVDEASQSKIFQKLNNFIGKIKRQPIDNWIKWETNPFQKIILARHRVELPKIKNRITLFDKHIYDHCYDEQEKNEEALELFNKVIDEEPIFSAAAHYYKAYTLIKSINFNCNPLDDTDKKTMIQVNDEFRRALYLFEQYIVWAHKSSATIANLKHNMSDSIVRIKGFEEQQKSFCAVYEEYIASIYSLVGRIVTPATFVSSSVNKMMAYILYYDLESVNILNTSQVNENIPADAVRKVENDYSLDDGVLYKYLKKMSNEPLDQKTLKNGLVLPSREMFWKYLIHMEILYDEEKYVIIDDPSISEYVSQRIRKQRMQYSDDVVFLNEITNEENQFVFIKSELVQEIGEKEYKLLKNMVTFNKKAKLDIDKIKSTNLQFHKFDSISAEDFKKIKCSTTETKLILKELVERNILRANDVNNIYRLQIQYSEIDNIDLPSFPVYNDAVIRLLHCCFAFRIALQQLVEDYESKCTIDVQIQLPSKIHRDLFFDLIRENVITPVSVNTVGLEEKYNNWKIGEKFIKHKSILQNQKAFDVTSELENIERILQESSGLLCLNRKFSYKLKSLEKHCENQSHVNVEELKLAGLNGLTHLIENYRTFFQKIQVWYSALANIFVSFINSVMAFVSEFKKI